MASYINYFTKIFDDLIRILIIQSSTKKNKNCGWNFVTKGYKYGESMRLLTILESTQPTLIN